MSSPRLRSKKGPAGRAYGVKAHSSRSERQMSLADRLRAALSAPSALPPLDGDLVELGNQAGVPAAVLIAITDRPAPGVILTVRREHLRTHAGQVAFPGGRIDPGEDAVAAALREAHEELGLAPNAVEVVGELKPYRTVTHYVVRPVIGVLPPDLPLERHEHEVADWFEAPLGHLLDPENQHRLNSFFESRRRQYYDTVSEHRTILG